MRKKFEEQLNHLNTELTIMGALCEDAISKASIALLTGDEQIRLEVPAIEEKIDEQERLVESMCVKMLLQQQPVARDLRQIRSALKMISDMERIGDQAADIAEISAYLQHSKITQQIPIKDMADAAKKMVSESVDSFVKESLATALLVIDFDDVVDNLFDEIKTKLINEIANNSNHGSDCIDLLMIAKYLERIGDHAVNIAEWVAYSITGEHKGV